MGIGLDQGCPTCGPLKEFVRPFIVLSILTTSTARQKEKFWSVLSFRDCQFLSLI